MNKKFNYDSNLQIYARIIKEAFLPNALWFGIAIGFMMIGASSIAYRAYLIKPAIDQVFLDKNTTALLLIPIKLILIAIAIAVTTFLSRGVGSPNPTP